MTNTTLDVPTISCGHCKSSIEGAVSGLSGVNKVEVGIESKRVEIDFDESAVNLDTIVETIEAQGYDVAR
ncbi:MAG: copper ion binding protein [Acidimicrobiia bacterium]|nr:copper ion binding protein [Acidimicrobiia bacterium]